MRGTLLLSVQERWSRKLLTRRRACTKWVTVVVESVSLSTINTPLQERQFVDGGKKTSLNFYNLLWSELLVAFDFTR